MTELSSTSHWNKRMVYKTNYASVREVLMCTEVAGQLYSKGVIGPEARDSKDPDKIAARVETCLLIREAAWDDLMDVIDSTHMADLASFMKAQLEQSEANIRFAELSIADGLKNAKPQTAPQMPVLDQTRSTRVRPSTSAMVPPSYNVNESAFFRSPPPSSLPFKVAWKQVDSGYTSDLEIHAGYPNTHFPPPMTSTPSPVSSRPQTSEWSLSEELRYQESESLDYGATQPLPVPAYSDPRNEDGMTSEIVQPQVTLKRERKMSEDIGQSNSFGVQKLFSEMAAKDAEIEVLRRKRKEDQELLSMKVEQSAKDNQVLNHKILEILDLESLLLKRRTELRKVSDERDYFRSQAHTFRASLAMAERNTHLSAIRLDSLNEDVSKLNEELNLSKQAVKQWEQWYEQVHSDNKYPCFYSTTS